MKHSSVMRGGESGAELARNLEPFVVGQATDTPEQGREVFTIDMLSK
jgi:hypothetical protein